MQTQEFRQVHLTIKCSDFGFFIFTTLLILLGGQILFFWFISKKTVISRGGPIFFSGVQLFRGGGGGGGLVGGEGSNCFYPIGNHITCVFSDQKHIAFRKLRKNGS